MATLIVTNTFASGAGSLADAVGQANAAAGLDAIVFAKALAGQTINLSGDLVLTNTVIINGDTNGDGDADITINTQHGVIVNHSGNTATLTSLTVSGGYKNASDTFGNSAGAVVNNGTLTLSYVYVATNTIYATSSSGNGGSAASLFNNGTLVIAESAFGSNSNAGDNGADFAFNAGGTGGEAGTIINRGTLTLDRTAFNYNAATGGHGGHGGAGQVFGLGGGNGGDAAGAILNSGTVSGNYGSPSNVATGGTGGTAGFGPSGYGANGNTGSSSTGLLNVGAGSGSLFLIQTGTMNGDNVSLDANAVFAGLGGADTISAKGGSRIDGGAGADVMTIDSNTGSGHAGSAVYGGLGNDTVVVVFVGYHGKYDGGGGRDTADFSLDNFIGAIDLSATSFTLFDSTFTRFENVTGSQGSNTIIGSRVANVLNGSGGNDTIEGGRGADKLDGGADIDTLSYEHSAKGVAVNLFLNTASGGDATGDTILNFENIIGSALDDTLKGNAGANVLSGGAGVDTLNGGGGGDTLDGGAGLDILTGGNGADIFVLSFKASSADTITDFKPVDDTLQISAADFGGGLVAGGLAAGKFVTNTTGHAGDLNDRFILNAATGELFFDSNGSGAGGSHLIATFTGSVPLLTAADFLII